MNLGVKPLSFGSSNDLRKSGDGVPGQFPAGLRVLVVDDDPTCLRILEKMLRNCLYEVTTCNRAEIALDFLRDERNVYDVVVSDVHMPDMDGFKLLEYVGLKMDLPVIMMSADDSKSVVMKGVTHGACDYLIKPVRMEALKNIWQHVVRRKKHEWKDKDLEQSESFGDQKLPEDLDHSSSASEGFRANSKKRKDGEEESEDRDESSGLKKQRVVWSIELHQQFVSAVNSLGIDKAVPKKILELMNVPGLTRENVASHLQKYRLYLRRLSNASHHPNGQPFVGPPDFPFGPMPPLNAFDLQALSASSQLPPQSLATLQAAALSRANADQRNISSFENPKLRFLVGHQQQQHNNTDEQVDLLHGIPTNMHVRPKSNSLLGPLVQPKNFDEVNPTMVSQPALGRNMDFPSSSFSQGRNTGMTKPREEANGSQGKPVLPQRSLGQPGPMVDNVRGQSMDLSRSSGFRGQPILQQAVPDKPVLVRMGDGSLRGRSMDFSGSSFSKPGKEVHGKFKGQQGFVHNYDVFNHLNQNRTQEWCLTNAGSSIEHSNAPNVCQQQVNLSLAENNPSRNKVERVTNVGFRNVGNLQVQFGQEDLISSLLKEQQESVRAGPIENELGGFDCYHLDNLPV